MNPDNPLTDLLRAPLDPDWTMERLAERLLGTVAAQPPGCDREFVLAVDDTTDPQSRRLLRPLLAHLATKFASEAGTPANLYGGPLSFERSGPEGVVWVLGHFENRPGSVRLEMRRSGSPATSRDPREQMSAPSFHELALVDPPQEGAANPSESYSDPRT